VDFIRQVKTKDWFEVIVELFALLKLSHEPWDSLGHWVGEFFSLGWGWSKAHKTASLKGFDVCGLYNGQEVEFVQAVLFVSAEAGSILSWVSENFAFTVLQELSSLGVVSEFLGF